ncbi:superoxide dismutase family protein [Novosphingobium sp. Gsoil 351]|uniref:superoxide dismutase family protein n=1 Tax=Novosphingobium sp. Gsoil 351 TaxID=2675225 RepID=UPI0012B4FE80|nr:superoxide dismutase family protein [Novosphingobium sp. Gsoil 351]QGN54689.1 superoxide dismutase family protein [Novosphingobium sp. Gsoil 351]
MRFHALVLPLLFAAAACGTKTPDAAPTAEASASLPMDAGPSAAPTRAAATLMTADGKDVGTVTVLPAGEGIRLAVQVKGMPAGEHGIHLHAVGKCEGPKFESAGGHWNPAGKKHGLANPDGPHAGDIPNLTVGQDGTGIVNTTLGGGTVSDLIDTDGAALVVHAKRDDGKTDPSGDSGDRIACAVLKAS